MCFQGECTNLQDKLNAMIDGYNRKLRLKKLPSSRLKTPEQTIGALGLKDAAEIV